MQQKDSKETSKRENHFKMFQRTKCTDPFVLATPEGVLIHVYIPRLDKSYELGKKQIDLAEEKDLISKTIKAKLHGELDLIKKRYEEKRDPLPFKQERGLPRRIEGIEEDTL